MTKKIYREIEEEISKGQIPLLHKDKDWIELFGNSKDKEIRKLKDEIITLEQEKLERENLWRKYNREKQKYLKLILKVSDSVNNDKKKENLVLLDEYRDRLLGVNEKLDEIEFDLETIPSKIRKKNKKLLVATIKKGYEELGERESDLKNILVEIDELNKKLNILLEQKLVNEEWISETYTFLHRLLGGEIIEKLDEKYSR